MWLYDSDPRETEPPALIILDANIPKSISLRGPAADMLRAVRAAKVERIAVPLDRDGGDRRAAGPQL